MLAPRPSGKSRDGLPATVTFPGLVGCRYWRWLPRVAICCQPSSSMSLMIARIFTPAPGGYTASQRADLAALAAPGVVIDRSTQMDRCSSADLLRSARDRGIGIGAGVDEISICAVSRSAPARRAWREPIRSRTLAVCVRATTNPSLPSAAQQIDRGLPVGQCVACRFREDG